MASFHNSFEQEDDYFHARAAPPVLADARVNYCLLGDGQCFAADNREYDKSIALTANCETTVDLGPVHENCWNFIEANTGQIEKELRRKLWAICRDNFQSFLEVVEPDSAEWLKSRNLAAWEDPSSLDVQVRLTGIGLFDHGFDEVGFCTFDFDVGWDEEHGCSILMHKSHVLAASSVADFIGRGSGVIDHATYIQTFTFTKGDLRIKG